MCQVPRIGMGGQQESAGKLETRRFHQGSQLAPKMQVIRTERQDFPGGPMVETLPSSAGGVTSIPGQRAKITHASWPQNQSIKQK